MDNLICMCGDSQCPSCGSAQDTLDRKERHTWIVAVYDAALAWGGPEEGGWWYDTGSLVRIVKITPSEEKAYAYARGLNARLESRKIGPNEGKREKSSVLSDGVFEAHVYADNAPDHFPAVRPHYE